MQYAGNNVFPVDFALADDGVPPTAAEVNVGLEALGDRTTWLQSRAMWRAEYLVDTVAPIVFPAGVAYGLAIGYGGGGGGGGGAMAIAIPESHAMAGAGGGAAILQYAIFPITPGGNYDVIIGTGGNGGLGGQVGGEDGQRGEDGTTTYVTGPGGDVMFRFGGGEGGGKGDGHAPTSGNVIIMFGGRTSIANANYFAGIADLASLNPQAIYFASNAPPYLGHMLEPGVGGAAVGRNAGRDGIASRTSVRTTGGIYGIGGFGGAKGLDSATHRGGGGGGGGGGGPTGTGGVAGTGGDANSVGVAGPGTNGFPAAANTGGGGGGGGGGGSGSSAANCGIGGNGAAGGSGRLWLYAFGVRT